MGLQTFCKTHYNSHLRILTDNTTAMAVLNHMGTSDLDPCSRLGKEIWEWCIDRNIWLSAAHIPGVHNIKADFEARRTNDNTEWMLDRAYLNNAPSQLSLHYPGFQRIFFLIDNEAALKQKKAARRKKNL